MIDAEQLLHVAKTMLALPVQADDGFPSVRGEAEASLIVRLVVGEGDPPAPAPDLDMDDPPEDWTPPDQDRAEGLREAASEWVSSHGPDKARVIVGAATGPARRAAAPKRRGRGRLDR